jgi:hypothetical protein
MTSARSPVHRLLSTAGAHHAFCQPLIARCRIAATRAQVVRVFLRSAATQVYSPVYAPVFATEKRNLSLTLAPSIRIDWTTIRTVLSGPTFVLPRVQPARIVTLAHSAPSIALTTRTALHTPGEREQPVPATKCTSMLVLRQFIEHRREEKFLFNHIRSAQRREYRPLDTVVCRGSGALSPALPNTLPDTPIRSPASTMRELHSPPEVTPREIPAVDVAQLTDRVVQQINRRVLAERERRGRT